MTTVRSYVASDLDEWRRMRTALWPDQTDADMRGWLARPDACVIVAERPRATRVAAGGLCGFVEVGARPYVDGCETSPVAYLEGWWVDADVRRRGVGAALVRAAEAWARARRYRELASDTALDNVVSQRAHARLGFAETERSVLYRKAL